MTPEAKPVTSMDFVVSTKELVRELNLSQGVVERKTTIPILSNVLLEAAEGQLTLTATDLELGIRCSCPARVKKAGAGTIPARRLLEYVRLLPETDLELKLQDNNWASLTCGRSRTRIAGMSRESFPELPQMPEPLLEIPAGLLASMIAKTIFAISAEESRFTLNGALLVIKNNVLTMVSTDGHRLALAESEMDSGSQPGASRKLVNYRALLPRKAMLEIQKLVQEAGENSMLEFAGDDNHLFFRLGERLLLSRKLTGNFPDYERVLPKEHPHSVSLEREELRGAIERVSQFSDERSRAIRVRFGAGELQIHSSVSETGESEESLAADFNGEKIDIGFNAVYLLEFLKAAPGKQVLFYFRDGNSAGELRPMKQSEEAGDATAEEYRYVVMPMRI